MKTLKDRLVFALEKRQMTQAELARATKTTEAAVSLWMNGTSKSMRSKALALAAAHLGCNMAWLANGSGVAGLGGDDVPSAQQQHLDSLSDQESRLVSYFRRCTEEQKQGILGAAHGIANYPEGPSKARDDDGKSTPRGLVQTTANSLASRGCFAAGQSRKSV